MLEPSPHRRRHTVLDVLCLVRRSSSLCSVPCSVLLFTVSIFCIVCFYILYFIVYFIF